MATEAIKKRAPFRRPPISQTDQIMRDRNRYAKENKAAAEIVLQDPSKVDWCWGLLEWCCLVLKPELEDDGSELIVRGE